MRRTGLPTGRTTPALPPSIGAIFQCSSLPAGWSLLLPTDIRLGRYERT
jgi:hypothetical protein